MRGYNVSCALIDTMPHWPTYALLFPLLTLCNSERMSSSSARCSTLEVPPSVLPSSMSASEAPLVGQEVPVMLPLLPPSSWSRAMDEAKVEYLVSF